MVLKGSYLMKFLLRIKQLPVFLLFALIFCFVSNVEARTFSAEGSDLLMGVGAENIGMSGAVSASTDDIFSLYWNPAGLAELNSDEVAVSAMTNAEILPINFAGAAFTTNWLGDYGLKSTIAVSYIPRLHVKSTGAFSKNELESIFLRFALPDLPGTFDGKIESKTKDYRISFGFKPEHEAKWSAGFSLARVDCTTFFCGTTARSPGEYIIETTKATAYGLNVGAKYFATPDLTFGFMFKDVNTKLDVELTTTYPDGRVKREVMRLEFPRDITLGVAWQVSEDKQLSFDYENIFGTYGKYGLDFRVLRAGYKQQDGSLSYHAGLVAPLKLESEKVGNSADDLVFPLAPSFGLSWNQGNYRLDSALFAQLLMSAVKKKVVPGFELTLTAYF